MSAPDTKKCRFCGKEFSSGMRMCPFCGGESRKPVIKNEPVCPRCDEKLSIYEYRDTELDICPKCSGIWLDVHEFRKLSSERDTYSDPSIPDTYIKKPLTGEVKYLPCVRCGSLMARRIFKKISGVLYDECPDHGVWLDAGELEQIRCFVANGGLEQYQEFLNHRIQKNHRDIQKLAGTVNNVKFMQQMMHLYKPKYWLLKLL
ncbi:MAG: zf-TFIIB domain-containing protein [Elusimicrobia bacterium]|nr:zf-TFIIB domain-containing protein [Elusimicrobiota bacterium]